MRITTILVCLGYIGWVLGVNGVMTNLFQFAGAASAIAMIGVMSYSLGRSK